jgi:hypothetical protein
MFSALDLVNIPSKHYGASRAWHVTTHKPIALR